jgi:uncharacterized protein (DUF3084 family)
MLTSLTAGASKLAPLGKALDDRTRELEDIDKRILALKESVDQAEQHAVEHAVVQANRVNDMVWAMDVQRKELELTLEDARNTLNALQHERTLAERITSPRSRYKS